MKQILILFFFIVTGTFVFSQDNDADSLLNVLNTSADDTSKVNTLNELFKFYQSDDPEKSFGYATKAFNLSEKLSFKRGMASSLNNIGLYYFNTDSTNDALENYLKALEIFSDISFKKGASIVLANIGNLFYSQSNYPKTIEYFQQSLILAQEIGDKQRTAMLLGNIGTIYYAQSNYAKALSYYFKSLEIREEINDKQGIAYVLSNIGLIYDAQKNYDKTLEYYEKSLKIKEEIDDKKGIANAYSNIGTVYNAKKDYVKALEYFQKSLTLATEIDYKQVIASSLNNIGNVYKDEGQYAQASEYYSKTLKINQELNDKKGKSDSYFSIAEVYFTTGDFSNALIYYTKSLENAEEMRLKDQMEATYKRISETYDSTGNYMQAYKYHQLYSEIKDSIYNEESMQQITDMQTKYETETKEKEITWLKKETELKDIKISRGYLFIGFIAGVLVLIIVLASVTYYAYRQSKKAKKVLEIQNKEIIKQKEEITLSKAELEQEKMKSDSLLLNILPYDTAEELKTKGFSTVRHFENVSVMFTDFVDFTMISKKIKPSELIEELNIFFNRFDEIISKYNLEKIKTIGDAYMCASGMHSHDSNNNNKIIHAAFELLHFVDSRNREKKKCGDPVWEIRIGIHSGDVIAGVVGKKKFAYDIWGDTVNTASRMESHGETGKINISGQTYDLIKKSFNCSYRGKIDVKNTDSIDMYFVVSLKEEIIKMQESGIPA